MVQRIGGLRRKSRNKMRKNYKTKGKTPLRKYLQKFTPGEKVVLAAEPAVQSGLYNLRFHGKVADVVKKDGSCYYVSVKDGSKVKQLIVNPVHLKRLANE